MTRTYGALGWARDPEKGTAWFALDVEPHVAVKVKRMLPQVRQGAQGLIIASDTPDTAADIAWLMMRYPLDMEPAVQARLESRVGEHEEYMTLINEVLHGRRVMEDFAEPARPGRDYQTIGADLAYVSRGLLLGDEVGLGKTQTGLMLLRDPATLPALLVVPTNVPYQWLREQQAVMPHLKGHVVESGRPIIKRQRQGRKVEVSYLDVNDAADADVLIMSYSKLAGWRDHLAGRINTVIFDEVQELRRTNSEKWAAAKHIADRAQWKMGLSATPIYNYADEAHNVYEVLAPGALGTREEFLREWGGQTMTSGVKIRDPRALGAFLTEQGLLLRRTRHEVGRELPNGKPIEVVVEIDSDTTATDAAMDDIVALAEKVLHAPDRTERFVAGGQMDLRLRHATGVDKAPHVATFLKMLLESEQKVAVAGWHRDVYDIWNRMLAPYRPVLYSGSENAREKDAAVRRFIEDDECRVFMCSLRSGAGLDGLQGVCNVAVFGELDWSPAMHHQFLGRFARDGQENEVVGYYLVSEVGSDPIISGVLEAKRQQAEQFMNQGQGALFTAVQDDGGRARSLAESVLARAGRTDVA